MMRRTVKSLARRAAPGFLKAVSGILLRSAPKAWRWLNPESEVWYALWREAEYAPRAVARKLVRAQGAVVGSGPFRGMRYVGEAVGSMVSPKLLGSYEAELHPWIEEIIATPYQSVLDIGCAEGYYAVGLAQRLGGDAKILAYDTDKKAQALCLKLARLNHVADSVTVKGLCDWDEIERESVGRTLIVCDCEGAELDLLNPEKAASLRHSDILVELHDLVDRRITAEITARFCDTHETRIIFSRDKSAADYPVLKDFSDRERYLALSEFRPEMMRWAFSRAKMHA